MKNILNTTLVILPLLMATSSQAGLAGKSVKGVKEVVRAEEAFAFNPFIGKMRVAPFGTVEREVRVFDKLRNRATNLFESNLSPESKHNMINELNAAADYFRKNPLRMDSEWTKKTFIEQQTKIIDHYGRSRRNQNAVSETINTATKKGGGKVGLR